MRCHILLFGVAWQQVTGKGDRRLVHTASHLHQVLPVLFMGKTWAPTGVGILMVFVRGYDDQLRDSNRSIDEPEAVTCVRLLRQHNVHKTYPIALVSGQTEMLIVTLLSHIHREARWKTTVGGFEPRVNTS